MFKSAIIAVCLGIMALVIGPTLAIAQVAAERPGIEYGAFLATFIPAVLEIASLIVLALLGWLSVWLKRKLNIDIEAKHREALHSAIMTGIGSALSKVGGSMQGRTLDVESPLLVEAANYVLRSVPDAVGYFGISRARILEMVAGKLAERVALPPVVASVSNVVNQASGAATALRDAMDKTRPAT